MSDTKKKISILICSYDGGEDLWLPLARSYKRYWADCPFDIYLLTNYQNPAIPLFKNIAIGVERPWSDKILACIEKIPEEHILLTYDDLFLNKAVDTGKIINLSKHVVYHEWSYFSFDPHIKLGANGTESFVKLNRNRQYRNSSPWTIYRKDILKELLVSGESAWEFEKNGSERSNKYDNFYTATDNTFYWFNAIVQGKWKPDIYKKLRRDGIISSTSMPMLNPLENLKRESHMIIFNILRALLPLSLAYKLAKIKNKKFSLNAIFNKSLDNK